jgi:cyclophilin family peptidyl-prolyl cis-trans isomerase
MFFMFQNGPSRTAAIKGMEAIVLAGLFFFSPNLPLQAADTAAAGGSAKQNSAAASSDKASAASDAAALADPGAEFKRLFSQWQAVLVNLAELQANFRVTTLELREALTPQYSAVLAQANTLASQLQAAAEKAYAAGERDPEIGQLLFTAALADIREDNYEEALRLAKLLIEHKYPDKNIYRVAATAAFTTMQLDEAKQYLEALGDGKVPPEPDLQSLAAEIEHYRPLWQREQKLRQAEAKADDLPRVKLHTTQGDIVLELFENEAPNTVANFISLVEKGLYDNTQFHRVLPGFMAQGGDPLSKDPEKNKDNIGKGIPGYFIADECQAPNHRDHFRGSLSMAHTAQPNSGGSQFFITFAPTPNLDGVHTVFGRVIEGMDVLSKLQRIDPEREHERPSGMQPDKIIKAEVLRKRNHPYEPKTIPIK